MTYFQNGNNCIKRYDFAQEDCDGDSGRCFAEIREDAEGEYVRLDDVVELVEGYIGIARFAETRESVVPASLAHYLRLLLDDLRPVTTPTSEPEGNNG